MNYTKIYEALIYKAKNRIIEGYVEKHHILPKCMLGSDLPENLVKLTAEEHYIAHLLLVKMFPKNAKLIYAANMMASRNNKFYSWIKKKVAIQLSIDNKGYVHTDSAKLLMSEKRKGVPKSGSHKDKIRKKHLQKIEYKGKTYIGYDDLKSKTGVSYHLYNKYYKNQIDPENYIGNNTYAIVEKSRNDHPRNASGKHWCNNGLVERYFDTIPDGWVKGRIKRGNEK
jgi:hypothetical protein